LTHIEWIFADEWNTNPIWTEEGVGEIRRVIEASGVALHSVCADYFKDVPYLRASGEIRSVLASMLERLVVQTSLVGGKFIDLPFVDASRIEGRQEFPLVQEFLEPALAKAASLGITITLETSLGPADFRALLEYVNHPHLAVNYDTGNSASLGYNCAEEIDSYGTWIKTVHIKDRKLHGSTVPLGTGNADLPTFFRRLSDAGFDGPLVFQAAREGDELGNARKNIEYVTRLLKGIGIA
jgi:hexulose-6-phosphate isomerase